MRDYKLVRYIAKITGAKPDRDKNFLKCFMPYDEDGVIPCYIEFEKGTSVSILFDLQDVHVKYAENKFPDYEAFLDRIEVQSNMFKKVEVEGSSFLHSDLRVNRLDHVASQALVNYSCNYGVE